MTDESNVGNAERAKPSSDQPAALEKKIGTVRAWMPKRKYGYITELDGTGQTTIFFHITSLVGNQPIEPGVIVEYVETLNQGKTCARRVRVIAGGVR